MQPSFVLKKSSEFSKFVIEQFMDNHKLSIEPKQDLKTPALKNFQQKMLK